MPNSDLQETTTMTSYQDFLDLLNSQAGDEYIFGVEVDPSDANPEAFDCSELIEWACARMGIQPVMPDGSWMQIQHCHKHATLISVDKALSTPGALLFCFSSSPFGNARPQQAHVAVSQGNGTTIEARGKKFGVGVFSAHGRGWTHAARVPGILYPYPVTGR